MSKENSIPDDDQEVRSETKGGASSRLGKEAKIGVSVIVVLLLVLGVAVAMRFRGPSADAEVAAADDVKEPSQQASSSSADAMLKDAGARYAKTANPPTILPATAASGSPPKSVDRTVDSWTLRKEHSEPKLDKTPQPTQPPLFAAQAATPPQHNRYEKLDLGQPSDKAKNGDAKPLSQATAAAPPAALPTAATKSIGMAASTPIDVSSQTDTPALPREKSRFEYQPQHGPAPSSELASQYAKPMRRDALADVPATPSYRRDFASYSNDSAAATAAPPAPAATVAADYEVSDYRGDTGRSRPTGGGFRRSAPASSYAPAPHRDDGKYEVQPNDSYYKISERLYGTGAYFKALAQHNRGKSAEDQLKPGELILAPTVAQLEQTYPDLCPKAGRREAMQSQSQARVSNVSTRGMRSGRTYTVVEGDTLFNIARYELGKASRWAELYELNRDVLGKDFNYLTPGIQLTLPESERPESMARRSSGDSRW